MSDQENLFRGSEIDPTGGWILTEKRLVALGEIV